MKEQVQQLAERYYSDVIAIRRHLHQHPELSFKETETGRYIAQKLRDYDIPHEHGCAENGVVGYIKGKNPERKVVALRADMDALPIQEANDVPYKSKRKGLMHACGHDVHTASLLGTARILHELRDSFEGSVKLIFQPAEERIPGGASLMIADGVLENPRPFSIFGQHVHPPLAAGKIGMRPGNYMASADELYLTVKGRGGHGALPQDCIDPILITAHLLTAIQQIVSRRATPTTPTVVTFGKINSVGGSTNVIPNKVKLEGTFRTMNEKWRREAHKRMKKLVKNMAKAMGGAAQLTIVKGYPVLVNNDELTAKARRYAVEYLGEENVVDLPIRMTAEDFAYFSHQLPACFYRLGTGNVAKGITSPVHTDTFDVDEDSMRLSTGLMAWMTLRELSAS
ncbi:MAG: M20 family metallopeptidase [Bacteroidota bacterium]